MSTTLAVRGSRSGRSDGDTVSVVYAFNPERHRVASEVTITKRGRAGAGTPRE